MPKWDLILLLGAFLLLSLSVAGQAELIERWRHALDEQHRRTLIREDLFKLQRLTAEAESGFRSYAATGQRVSLDPLGKAEEQLRPILDHLLELLADSPPLQHQVRTLGLWLLDHLRHRRWLTSQIDAGFQSEVISSLPRGEALALLLAIENAFRELESRVDHKFADAELEDEEFRRQMLRGLLLAECGIIVASGVTGGLLVLLFRRFSRARVSRTDQRIAAVGHVAS